MAEATNLLTISLLSTTVGFKKLASTMSVARYEKSKIVIYEGDTVKNFYFIKSGYIKVYNINEDGEERTLLLRRPGDIFPLLKDPASPSYVSPYFFETMTEAEIGKIDQEAFLAEASTNRDSAWALLRYISEFSSLQTDRLRQIENKTAEGKLENLLPYLDEICGQSVANGRRLGVKLTHQDLASLLGVARETVSREMQTLAKRGVIEANSGHIVIKKMPNN